MAGSFLVLWSSHRHRQFVRAGCVGQPLSVWFGGIHTSAPGLTHFGARPGDALYPVSVRGGVMHLVGRLDVDALVPVRRYLAERFGISQGEGVRWWDEVDRLLISQPALTHLLPTGCITEAGVGQGRTAIRFDRALPGRALERLRLKSRTGPERGLRYLEDGRLKKVQTLLGRVYRLSERSAADFAEMFAALESEGGAGRLARCLSVNPVRAAPAIDSGWRAWNDGAIGKLAQMIHDERAFDRLPLLADALEDAGCLDAEILGHCRQVGEHVRGCWVIDLLLGKA